MKNHPMMDAARWLSEAEVYKGLEAGFDELAPSYEEDVGGNLIGMQMRDVFRAALRAAFPRTGRLFEIGCGTGIDAVWMAGLGFEVVATDISEEMLSRVREKAKAGGFSANVQCRRLAARDIGDLVREFGEGSFDGAYCHAGALNMEPEIARVPAELHRLIKSGGNFVCSVINKTSLFEILFYPLALRPRKAFRRLGKVVPLPISRKPPLNRYVVPARFYSPNDLRRLFGGTFTLQAVQGVRIILPPSNLTDEYAKVRNGMLALEGLEARISRMPLLRSCGHHSVLTFARN